MEAYNPELWHEFFALIAEISAVLAGLVFVAMELNTSLVLKDVTHRSRAIGTIGGFMAIVVVGCVGVMGHQTNISLGIVWALAAFAGLGVYVRGLFDGRGSGMSSHFGVSRLRVTLGILSYVGQIFGAVLLAAGNQSGIYIAASFMVFSLVYLVTGAWLLFVGVSIQEKKSELQKAGKDTSSKRK